MENRHDMNKRSLNGIEKRGCSRWSFCLLNYYTALAHTVAGGIVPTNDTAGQVDVVHVRIRYKRAQKARSQENLCGPGQKCQSQKKAVHVI